VIRALEGILIKGEEKHVLQDVHHGMKHGISEDAVALAAQELQKGKDKILHSAEWGEKDGLLFF